MVPGGGLEPYELPCELLLCCEPLYDIELENVYGLGDV